MTVVEIKDLHFQYETADEPILNGINMTLEKGKLYSLIGSNGGGKTTLGNAIRGFVPKFHTGEYSGEVTVFGERMEDLELEDLADKIGLIFQNPFTQMSGSKKTVFEELAFGLENLGVEREEIIRRVNDIIELTKIEEFRNRNPFQLSGGQQQRVALAAVLVMDQDVLIIDEPTSQLDPQSTDYIFEIINKMKEEGKTILLIEHKIEQVAEFSDYVYVIEDGKIAREGTPDELFRDRELLSHGANIPKIAQICLELKDRGIDIDKIPITLDEFNYNLTESR